MNPFLVAHFIADFLLQPKRLVEWKMKNPWGVAAHAAVHGLVMLFFVQPKHLPEWVIVLVIALSHAGIDQLKINAQKHDRAFEPKFILDQLAHFLVIIFFSSAYPIEPFWVEKSGIVFGATFMTITYAVALKNLVRVQGFPLKNSRDWLTRFSAVSGVFVLFFLTALFLA